MTNKSLQGLVKIGKTTNDPEVRAKQLSTTGVPSPFKVYGYIKVYDLNETEKKIHRELSKYRKNKRREFFKLKPEEAIQKIQNISGKLEILRQEQTKAEELRNQKELLKRKEAEYQKQVLNIFLSVAEKFEKSLKVKFFSDFACYSGLLALAIFAFGALLFQFLNDYILIYLIAAWASIGGVHLIAKKIADFRYNVLEKGLVEAFEDRYKDWNKVSSLCLSALYEKYRSD